ncbi:hypothetical protein [Enterovirga aerilata]|uniref:Uncharacterized protein n=1 Tax=Enterovirga aerilata TaxID=2730920 RepID=A0A849I9V9_9HYPH|nr:hypothetical protein [Enterovirga sp. DB1703]NNM74178.1 hypothetical protein [Enterovirga sp. DB1703]
MTIVGRREGVLSDAASLLWESVGHAPATLALDLSTAEGVAELGPHSTRTAFWRI